MQCRDLAPTWETLAEIMIAAADSIAESKSEGRHHEWTDEEYLHAQKVEMPVMIAKIDCVTHQALCREQNIRAYPTLRLFVDGEFKEDYARIERSLRLRTG
jgi:thiol-disulfide isomerase/thioredoxin